MLAKDFNPHTADMPSIEGGTSCQINDNTRAPKRSFLFAIVLLVLLLGSGFFLRFYQLASVYTEYDDIGVIGLYKSQATEEGRSYQILKLGPIALNIKTDAQQIKSLLDSILFPCYVAFSWTYPPGQYVLYPFLLSESDSYYSKVWKARAISAFAGCLMLVVLVWLLINLADGHISCAVYGPIAVAALASNSILYAHHMSPYAFTGLSTAVALLWAFRFYQQRISFPRLCLGLAFLTYFNYLILLLLPPVIVSWFLISKSWFFASQNGSAIRFSFKQLLLGILGYFLCCLPLFLLFFKAGAGFRGIGPPEFAAQPLSYFSYFPRQFLLSAASILSNGYFSLWLWQLLVFFLVVLALVRFIATPGKYRPETLALGYLCVFFLLEWVAMHAAKKIVMDQSRHVISWLPILVTLAGILLVNSKIWLSRLVAIFSVPLLVVGSLSNVQILNSKTSQFDFKLIEESPIDTLLTYAGTLSPLVYFDKKKRVLIDDAPTFVANSQSLQLPKRMLLVSQSLPFSEYPRSEYQSRYQLNHNFYSLYRITSIQELRSQSYFTFNDYSLSSNPNGFYLYEMELREREAVF